jgi:hypothetical protein
VYAPRWQADAVFRGFRDVVDRVEIVEQIIATGSVEGVDVSIEVDLN